MTVPGAPEDVFPWLLDEDKVPQWTTRLEAYEVLGDSPMGAGTRVRQVLRVRGEPLEVELEVTGYDPPRSAQSRFSLQGIDVVTGYSLAAAGEGTELSQTLEGKATSFKSRLLLPVVQPHLENKVAEDLGRLRELLSG